MAAKRLPPPSRSPLPDPGEAICLSERINVSTRSLHTKLNRMILASLPLALPPHTSGPSIYSFGLLHITPIYITYESLWQTILDSDNQGSSAYSKGIHTTNLLPQIEIRGQILSVLSSLRVPGLPRSEQLRSDIKTLFGITDIEVDTKLHEISQHGRLSVFTTHTTEKVTKQPHVLLAYAWVMYMALFSGGRYLRASLRNAGPEFRMDTQSGSFDQCLQFFNFTGPEDGEDIKRDFKRRFTDAERHLSEQEKVDIIEESQQIFSFMVDIVDELDQACSSSMEPKLELSENCTPATIDSRNLHLAAIGRPRESHSKRSQTQRAHRLFLIGAFESGLVKLDDIISNRRIRFDFASSISLADVALVMLSFPASEYLGWACLFVIAIT